LPATNDPFKDALARAGSTLAENEAAATRAIQTFANGAQGNLHETLLAVDKAEISLKLLVTVRNRLVDAYREVMRMGT
jgi:flagellar hook-basal body complex protein FliE